jgi:hypothetical protein
MWLGKSLTAATCAGSASCLANERPILGFDHARVRWRQIKAVDGFSGKSASRLPLKWSIADLFCVIPTEHGSQATWHFDEETTMSLIQQTSIHLQTVEAVGAAGSEIFSFS